MTGVQEFKKPILCVDFDGVLHSYKSGWQGATNIPDPPVKGAIAFLREAVKHFRVCIYSSRSNEPSGITAMANWIGYWMVEHRLSDTEDLAWASAIEWPATKPSAKVTIDDRAIPFNGTWPTMDELKHFKPWNMRTPKEDRDRIVAAAKVCRATYCSLVPGKRTWDELSEREQEADILSLTAAFKSLAL